ncbi:DUF5765 domain-containing protein [Amorphus sp. MBR-141]
MCWGLSASLTMVGIGTAATVVTAAQRRPAAIPVVIGYFTAMEGLQAAGYLVVDQCGNPVNQVITFLSVLHIIFQPFFINAFAMELVPEPVRRRARLAVYAACGLSAAVMLMQLYPFDWAGACRPGSSLCGAQLCTVSGEWHIGWEVPFNGMMIPLEQLLGIPAAFPTYALAVFAVPLAYGAWRFVLFHALAGPLLASLLTSDPNEMPAIWCLFSVGIVIISLSPWMWRRFERRPRAAA